VRSIGNDLNPQAKGGLACPSWLSNRSQRRGAGAVHRERRTGKVEQERHPVGAIEGNRYDAVIATNVLHATSDMRETVRNAKALLKRGGMLLVNEISAWSWQTHFTFGLLA